VTAREAIYLAVMLALGLRVARDIIAQYRWTPSIFLHGLVVLEAAGDWASMAAESGPADRLRVGVR